MSASQPRFSSCFLPRNQGRGAELNREVIWDTGNGRVWGRKWGLDSRIVRAPSPPSMSTIPYWYPRAQYCLGWTCRRAVPSPGSPLLSPGVPGGSEGCPTQVRSQQVEPQEARGVQHHIRDWVSLHSSSVQWIWGPGEPSVPKLLQHPTMSQLPLHVQLGASPGAHRLFGATAFWVPRAREKNSTPRLTSCRPGRCPQLSVAPAASR